MIPPSEDPNDYIGVVLTWSRTGQYGLSRGYSLPSLDRANKGDIITPISFDGNMFYCKYKKHTVQYDKDRLDEGINTGELIIIKTKGYTTPATAQDYNTVCPKCKAPAYQGLNKLECSNSCT